MLHTVLVQQKQDFFRSLFFQAYQFGLSGHSSSFNDLLKKEDDPLFKKVIYLIFECGEHDKKHNEQKQFLKQQRRFRLNVTVDKSYLFIGKDIAVNEGMKELQTLVKRLRG